MTSAAGQVRDQTDDQLWTDIQLSVPVTKRFDFTLLGGFRLGRDISHLIHERIGAGFTFRVNKYLSLSPNYLNIATQPFTGVRMWENRLSLPIQVQFNARKWTLTDRNLFERRFRDRGVRSTRYRNRFQLDHPIGRDGWKFSVFVADEVIYDLLVDRWTRNRFSLGATRVFSRHFTQDVYYVRQNDSFSVPGDLNVIGTTLRFRL